MMLTMKGRYAASFSCIFWMTASTMSALIGVCDGFCIGGRSLDFGHSAKEGACYSERTRCHDEKFGVLSTVQRKSHRLYRIINCRYGSNNVALLSQLSGGQGGNNDNQDEQVVAGAGSSVKKSTKLQLSSIVDALPSTTDTIIKDPFAALNSQLGSLAQPLQKVLDDTTGGWALSYANLYPETEKTPIGISFLLTNIAYATAGIILTLNGDVFLGTLTELASVASFAYHYYQLRAYESEDGSTAVRLALLIDYIIASASILTGVVYLALDQQIPSMETISTVGLALGFLGASWIWEEGLLYIFFHSLWHLLSAYAGYIIGNGHITNQLL